MSKRESGPLYMSSVSWVCPCGTKVGCPDGNEANLQEAINAHKKDCSEWDFCFDCAELFAAGDAIAHHAKHGKTRCSVCDELVPTDKMSVHVANEGHEKTPFMPKDAINPAHYRDGKIEVIDFIEDKKLSFCLGNVVKYVSRAGKKDPTKTVEDLKKAKWYLEREIARLEKALAIVVLLSMMTGCAQAVLGVAYAGQILLGVAQAAEERASAPTGAP